MIVITNGKHTVKVSRNTYENMYKDLGYTEQKSPVVEKNVKNSSETKVSSETKASSEAKK
jgi:hypothetical protein